MKNYCRLMILFLLAVLQSSFVSAQVKKINNLKSIESYCKTVDAFAKRNKRPVLIFADTSDENSSKPRWRKFVSEKSLEKFREASETYKIAYNWQKNGKIVRSNFTFFSSSGDWTQYVYHYFREDGTVAKVQSDMRTFNGDLIILQTLYFDSKGKLLQKKIEYKDLQTQKPKKPDPDFVNSDFVNGVDYFKKTNKLPFIR
jgi:hypothetical protein